MPPVTRQNVAVDMVRVKNWVGGRNISVLLNAV